VFALCSSDADDDEAVSLLDEVRERRLRECRDERRVRCLDLCSPSLLPLLSLLSLLLLKNSAAEGFRFLRDEVDLLEERDDESSDEDT